MKPAEQDPHFFHLLDEFISSKTCVKWPLSKRPLLGFQDQLSLNAGQKYCRMLQGEHSAVFMTFIKLPVTSQGEHSAVFMTFIKLPVFINLFVLSIFEWPFYTGFTVIMALHHWINGKSEVHSV